VIIRRNRFVILFTEEERQAIETLARAEKLPTSIMARRLLLFTAEQYGIVPPTEDMRDRGALQSDLEDVTVCTQIS
jgi:hypothetical protein